jgi:coenzyme F420 biosynthesis associated uncharacterized protein
MSKSAPTEPASDASGAPAAASLVDWEYAVRLGTRFAGDGPVVSRAEADDAVAELRAGAERSTGLVREFTGLTAAERTAPILVVDRGGWVQANAESFAVLLEPIMEKVAGKKAPGPAARVVGGRIAGTELGVLLGFMGSRVLGQFDPFTGDGRLLLVAPNVVHIERELKADASDFRLWVCLHEETHRVQFTAVPWMRDHIKSQVDALSATFEPQRMLGDTLKGVSRAVRGEGGSLMELMSTPEQREIIDRVTGVMSLLEGHADVVMDGVGPEVIPSVEAIRAKFSERRAGVGVLDRVLRRLMGLDAKMAQYRDGASFVRHVVDKVGMEGFNAVWASPEQLPSKAEIHDPTAWVARVHG